MANPGNAKNVGRAGEDPNGRGQEFWGERRRGARRAAAKTMGTVVTTPAAAIAAVTPISTHSWSPRAAMW